MNDAIRHYFLGLIMWQFKAAWCGFLDLSSGSTLLKLVSLSGFTKHGRAGG